MLKGTLTQKTALQGNIQSRIIQNGEGGTSNYEKLKNLPQINGVELIGNKTSEELGLAGADDLTKYVKFTDYASTTKAGVGKSNTGMGIGVDAAGYFYVANADNSEIEKKSNRRKPIVPATLDYAVKVGLTTNTETLTDEEKTQAQSWLGVDDTFLKKNTTLAGNRVYGSQSYSDGTINQTTVVYSSTSADNTLALRGNGGTLAVGTPTSNNHATTKKYVDDIFNGANKAVSFVNYSAMISSLNALSNTSYSVGQNIMIVTLQVPDLWVSEITEESVAYTYVSDDDFVNELNANGSVQVGFYKLSALETQKVDLIDYAKISQLDELNTNISENYVKKVTSNRCLYGRDNGVEKAIGLDYSNIASVNNVPVRANNGAIMITDKSCEDGWQGQFADGLQAVNKNYVKSIVPTFTATQNPEDGSYSLTIGG